jgi:hypothetical protein
MQIRTAKVALVLLLGLASCSQPAPESRTPDDPIVNKALDIYGKGKVSRSDLLRSYDVNVVYLPNMTCVGLNLRPGTAGGDDTMCFDKSEKLVLTYVNGD